MKTLLITLLIFNGLIITNCFAKQQHYSANVVPKNMSVQEKKKRFFTLLVPPIEYIHKLLQKQYLKVKKDLQNHTNQKKIVALKKKYGVKTDKELLVAIKPHPMSITLAQAAIESAWGTSRFFCKANNIFGVWSTSSKKKRIAALQKRGKKTIWVRKFDNLNEAIRQYYFMLSSSSRYKIFKKMNYEDKPATEIIKGLKYYSERGNAYIKEIRSVIRHNKLTKYDK
ncbi:MAG: glucosaminidase domain-containing protein [Sulfurovum sp.]|nr:glucosaminidase domain-containing protein [Sulfurovum sp.]MCB4745980.1 glucosaminidase domain-containing protein [Sulfurovum sp.]MCB4750472.1 glucosaminidase domain-containing protein [Sulfurovum sp.]MCB4755298.1 glucosaminidase domain-containing protein [Sulfurovum sp.]MCB4761835.1 glucosaminidase domain-containing protein [Sulfurovum sp.]